MKTNIGLLLTKRAHLNPEREAYVESDGSRRYSFKELNERSNRLANGLIENGLQKGDRVGLLLMNSVEFMESFFAVAKVGGVVVPLNWRLVADELEFILKDSGVKTLIFDNDFAGTVAELESRGDKTDISQWLHVLGGADASACQPFAKSYDAYCADSSEVSPPVALKTTTCCTSCTRRARRSPKGVVHTHSTAMWGVFTIHATADYQANERYIACLPMFHVGALTPLTINAYHGATTYVMRSLIQLPPGNACSARKSQAASWCRRC